MRSSFALPFWLLFGLSFSITRAEAAITYVQGTWVSGTASSLPVTYPSVQSAGGLNVVVVSIPATASITAVTDSAGDTYTLAGTTTANGGTQAVYYAKNVVAVGSNVVTATFNSSTYAFVTILQYSGIDLSTPLDGFAAGSGTGTSAFSGSVTATTMSSLIVGAVAVGTGSATVGSAFTSRVNSTGTGGGLLAEDRIVAATGSYTASATLQSSTTWLAQAIVFRGAATGDTQAPTAPTNLSATAASSSQINLSWTASTDNVGVTGYRVERCQGSGCSSFAQIATPSGTTFNDTGLTASTSYSYRVRAQDVVPNLSGYSNTASATTQAAGDTQAPTTPTGFTLVAASSNEIDLAWNASTDNVGVTAYIVERCQGASCSSWSTVATPTVTRFNDTSRSASTSYSYRVSARDAANNASLPSTVITYVTPASSPDCN